MSKPSFILILSVPGNTDRTEFEPDAKWANQPDGRVFVTQYVNKEGGYLVGATETYREHLSTEVLADLDRFIALVPNHS
jgi:hypothetical protein